jgi:hypothetical protein
MPGKYQGQNGGWGREAEGTFPDPLAGFIGKPFISDGGPKSTYVGRVIVELWVEPPMGPQPAERSAADVDAGNIAYSVDARDGNNAELLRRIAAALPIRVGGRPT